jgi:hypothetical protein
LDYSWITKRMDLKNSKFQLVVSKWIFQYVSHVRHGFVANDLHLHCRL